MIILRQNTFSKIGELRNRAIRDKAARMIRTANKNLKDARNKMIQETTDKTHKILSSNNPERGKNRRLKLLYNNVDNKLALLDKKEGIIKKAVGEFQEKFPKGSSISRDESKTGKMILDRYKRENVIMNEKQKNYSRKRIKRNLTKKQIE